MNVHGNNKCVYFAKLCLQCIRIYCFRILSSWYLKAKLKAKLEAKLKAKLKGEAKG